MTYIPLKVLGLSYSNTQTGAYVLLLSSPNDNRKIPIIIGSSEAQSIAINLENVKIPRPLTHELFVNFAKAYNVVIMHVLIYKMVEGVFYAKLVCKSNYEDGVVNIEARTSDAVALAIRFDCPIYITNEIMIKAGIILSDHKELKQEDEEFTLEALQQMLEDAIAKEKYEDAAKINEQIKKIKKE